mgnify:CR=1 FL=1
MSRAGSPRGRAGRTSNAGSRLSQFFSGADAVLVEQAPTAVGRLLGLRVRAIKGFLGAFCRSDARADGPPRAGLEIAPRST